MPSLGGSTDWSLPWQAAPGVPSSQPKLSLQGSPVIRVLAYHWPRREIHTQTSWPWQSENASARAACTANNKGCITRSHCTSRERSKRASYQELSTPVWKVLARMKSQEFLWSGMEGSTSWALERRVKSPCRFPVLGGRIILPPGLSIDLVQTFVVREQPLNKQGGDFSLGRNIFSATHWSREFFFRGKWSLFFFKKNFYNCNFQTIEPDLFFSIAGLGPFLFWGFILGWEIVFKKIPSPTCLFNGCSLIVVLTCDYASPSQCLIGHGGLAYIDYSAKWARWIKTAVIIIMDTGLCSSLPSTVLRIQLPVKCTATWNNTIHMGAGTRGGEQPPNNCTGEGHPSQ